MNNHDISKLMSEWGRRGQKSLASKFPTPEDRAKYMAEIGRRGGKNKAKRVNLDKKRRSG